MDFTLEILLPQNEITKLNISEVLFEWGGEKYSQDPPVYKDDTGREFSRVEDLGYYTRYYKRYIENDFDVCKYVSLRLMGTQINDLSFILNKKQVDISKESTFLFLKKLYDLSSFAIFLIRDEEEIDSRYRVNTKDEFLHVFCKCLNWEKPEGVLITKL